MKRIHALLTVGALVLGAAGCSGSSSSGSVSSNCKPKWTFNTLSKGTLRVAGVASLPALQIDPASGKATGIDAGLVQQFAKESCVSLKWQSLSGPAGVAAMTEKNADVAAGGWWISPARGKTIGQTDPAWYDLSATLSKDGVDSIKGLAPYTVGVEGGSVYESLPANGVPNVKVYQSIDTMLQDLDAGRVQAVIATSSQLGYQVKVRKMTKYKFKILPPDTQYPELTSGGKVDFPFTKGNDALGNALNAYIAQARKDGTVQNLLKKYGLNDPRSFTGEGQ